MNKIVLALTISILASFDLKSQVEFAPIGSKWILNDLYEIGFPALESISIYESESDTLIGNKTFRKVNDWLFYQENDKVYYLHNDTLRMIYDFDVIVSDTLIFEMITCHTTSTSSNKMIVTKVDSILFDNSYLKRITCDLVEGDLPEEALPYVYLEKIGSSRKLIEDLAGCFFVPGYENEKLRCFIEGTQVYKTDWFQKFGDYDCEIITDLDETHFEYERLQIHPNPTNNLINIKSENQELISACLKTATGQIVKKINLVNQTSIELNNLKAGLYLLCLYGKNNKLLATEKIIKI